MKKPDFKAMRGTLEALQAQRTPDPLGFDAQVTRGVVLELIDVVEELVKESTGERPTEVPPPPGGATS